MISRRFLAGMTALLCCAMTTVAFAQSTPPVGATPQSEVPKEPPAKNDYGRAESWLCRPGRTDACSADQTTTVVQSDGKTTREDFVADAQAPVDCFYVYPTVSQDPTPNSDMIAGPEERSVISAQLARFGSQCRVYAPLYRQLTLNAVRAMTTGGSSAASRVLAYQDVLDAWTHYMENDNGGRGVVLIGHSQGSAVLMQLIREKIDGKPIQKQIVSALLLGFNVAVPKGKDVGGAFQNLPLCRSAQQTGCVISYVSFRATAPPPTDSIFGRVPGDGLVAACVNPAALAGGKSELHAYLPAGRVPGPGSSSDAPAQASEIKTPFVSLPGLLSGECVSDDKGSYLAITVNGNPADPRPDDIRGDVVMNGQVVPQWGLHLIDVNLAIGDLVEVVKGQSAAYRAAATR